MPQLHAITIVFFFLRNFFSTLYPKISFTIFLSVWVLCVCVRACDIWSIKTDKNFDLFFFQNKTNKWNQISRSNIGRFNNKHEKKFIVHNRKQNNSANPNTAAFTVTKIKRSNGIYYRHCVKHIGNRSLYGKSTRESKIHKNTRNKNRKFWKGTKIKPSRVFDIQREPPARMIKDLTKCTRPS